MYTKLLIEMDCRLLQLKQKNKQINKANKADHPRGITRRITSNQELSGEIPPTVTHSQR